jgi:hypothetical protein
MMNEAIVDLEPSNGMPLFVLTARQGKDDGGQPTWHSEDPFEVWTLLPLIWVDALPLDCHYP